MLVRYEFLIILNLYANEASYQRTCRHVWRPHYTTIFALSTRTSPWPWTCQVEKSPKPECFMLDDLRIDKLVSPCWQKIKTLSLSFRKTKHRNVVDAMDEELTVAGMTWKCGGGMTLISFAGFAQWKRNFLYCVVYSWLVFLDRKARSSRSVKSDCREFYKCTIEIVFKIWFERKTLIYVT